MSDLLLKLTWACLACVAVGMIKPNWILPKEWQPTRRKVFGVYSLVALLAFIGFLATHEDPAKKAAEAATQAKQQAALTEMIAKGQGAATRQNVATWPQIVAFFANDREVVDVRIGPFDAPIMADVEIKSVLSAESTSREISSKIDKFMKGFIPISENTQTLDFRFDLPTLDRLGNEGKEIGLQISFKTEILRKVNLANVSGPQWFEVAEKIEVWPIMKDGARKFCETRLTQYPRYCRAAMKSGF